MFCLDGLRRVPPPSMLFITNCLVPLPHRQQTEKVTEEGLSVGPVVGSYSSSVKRIEEERVLKWGEKVRKNRRLGENERRRDRARVNAVLCV